TTSSSMSVKPRLRAAGVFMMVSPERQEANSAIGRQGGDRRKFDPNPLLGARQGDCPARPRGPKMLVRRRHVAGSIIPKGDAAVRRRHFLQHVLAGAAGVSPPGLLRCRAATRSPARTALILLYCHGGISHLDTWDPKPDAPAEIRGPFRAIQTRVP